MRSALGAAAIILFAVAALNLGAPASAQTASFATDIENGYPNRLTFHLSATAGGEIVDVSLRYSVTGAGASALAKPDALSPGARISTAVQITTGGNDHIPVGNEFVYFWELTLDDGSQLVSETNTFFYLPPGRVWSRVENEFMHIHYYGDRETLARDYLAAAAATYERIGRRLLRTELEVVPVNVVLFGSEAEMQEGRPSRGETYDGATFTCGSQLGNTLFMIAASCGTGDIADTLRHEFTHILTKAAGEGALTKLPAWLDEGTAVYSQTVPGSGYTDSFDAAVTVDRLIDFIEIAAQNSNPVEVGIFYGQSYEMVRFLIGIGGDAQFAELFATIKAGNRFDNALEIVYGFDLDGFEEAFRQANGLSSSATEPEPQPTTPPQREQPDPATPVPTNPPEQIAPPSRGGNAGDNGLSGVAVGTIGGAVVLALLALLAYLVSMMLANREPQTAGAPQSAGRSAEAAAPPSEAPEAEQDEWGPR